MKKCSKCKVEKPEDLDHFNKHPSGKNGLEGYCKSCHNARQALWWRSLSPEQKLERGRKGRELRGREVERIANRRWREKNPEKSKRIQRHYRLRKYGLTESEFEVILSSQAGRCAICGCLLGDGQKRHIDHRHSTGKIRGILCRNCNTALGKFQDSEEVLTSAIEYLRKNK